MSLYLQHFSAEGIKKDNALRKDLEDFLKNDYPQTLGRMLNNDKAKAKIAKKWWPGDEEVIMNYDLEQRKRWEALDLRIDDYIKKDLAKLAPGSLRLMRMSLQSWYARMVTITNFTRKRSIGQIFH